MEAFRLCDRFKSYLHVPQKISLYPPSYYHQALTCILRKNIVYRDNYSELAIYFCRLNSEKFHSCFIFFSFIIIFVRLRGNLRRINFSNYLKRTFGILNAQSLRSIKRRNTWDVSKVCSVVPKRGLLYLAHLCSIHLL